jgi:hypothetical protein
MLARRDQHRHVRKHGQPQRQGHLRTPMH